MEGFRYYSQVPHNKLIKTNNLICSRCIDIIVSCIIDKLGDSKDMLNEDYDNDEELDEDTEKDTDKSPVSGKAAVFFIILFAFVVILQTDQVRMHKLTQNITNGLDVSVITTFNRFLHESKLICIPIVFIVAVAGFFFWDIITTAWNNFLLSIIIYMFIPNKMLVITFYIIAVLYGIVNKDAPVDYRYEGAYKKEVIVEIDHLIRHFLYAASYALITLQIIDFKSIREGDGFLSEHTVFIWILERLLLCTFIWIPKLQAENASSHINFDRAWLLEKLGGKTVVLYALSGIRLISIIVAMIFILSGFKREYMSNYFIILLIMVALVFGTLYRIITIKGIEYPRRIKEDDE